MRSWRLSQPAYGELAEQRKQLSRWAMSAGKGPALLELGKLAPPELEAGGDSWLETPKAKRSSFWGQDK